MLVLFISKNYEAQIGVVLTGIILSYLSQACVKGFTGSAQANSNVPKFDIFCFIPSVYILRESSVVNLK
jgi:hypothetical protein